MSWDGMYPPHPCRECGKQLNADGGHPAELYAGTYTGLCYGCERKPVRIVQSYEDGAIRLSYAPHCPSWRREREEYQAYPNCPDCDGKGMKIIDRSFAHGGPYPAYCKPCSDRFWNYPPRKLRSDKLTRGLRHLYDAANALYNREVQRRWTVKELKDLVAQKYDFTPIAKPYWERYKAARSRWEQLIDRKYPAV